MEFSNGVDVAEKQPLPRVVKQQLASVIADAARAKRSIVNGIWVYFVLLIFEGALRKWVLPGLATPLLIVRDPVAIWLLIVAWRNNLLPFNSYIRFLYAITGLAMITALLIGHGSLVVALYGARIFLFHFPLMFLIGHIFTRDDVVKLGKVLLWMSIPMTILIAMQFYSPQSAFVNRGVGGDLEGGGFSGALGYFRPPGTFSFTTGNSQFYCFLGVFIAYFLLNPKSINRVLLISSTVCLIAAVPLSISRTLTFQLGVTFAFTGLSVLRNPKFLGRLILALVGLFVILLLLRNVSFFQTATEALTARFDGAGEDEGGIKGTLGDRFLGGLISAVTTSEQPFFGYGIGMGTNAGAKLLRGGDVEFLIAEEEWGRLVGEMGTVLGLSVIIIRLWFCISLAKRSYYELVANNLLPWLLLSWGFVVVLQSQWAQPTTLGFSTLIGGLIIAALGKKQADEFVNT